MTDSLSVAPGAHGALPLRPWKSGKREPSGATTASSDIGATDDAPPASERYLPRYAYNFTVAAFLGYAFRDTLTGSLRYYLELAHLGPIWFVPDLMSFICAGFFIWHIVLKQRSIPGVLILLSLLMGSIVGLIVMQQTLPAYFSSIKEMTPLLVGFCFAGRSAMETKTARYTIAILMAISVIGISLNPYVEYPWVGQTIGSFGFERQATKVWWFGEEIRYGGFAGDSTMAAFMCIFSYFMIVNFIKGWIIPAILFVPVYYAVDLSTSRTATITLIFFVVVSIARYLLRNSLSQKAILVAGTRLSSAFILIPFILIGVLSGVDLMAIDQKLYSIQDRINNSWQKPFLFFTDQFPLGLFSGCGLGCFSYPMEYSVLSRFNNPIDNFYINTYLMMGIPFLIFVIAVITKVPSFRYHSKLLIFMLINCYTITVSAYGPSYATLVVGYAMSDAFLKSQTKWKRRFQHQPDLPTRP